MCKREEKAGHGNGICQEVRGNVAEDTIAFADESVRVSADPPLYLIAATIVPAGATLSSLESLLPKSATKLHWRDMGPRAQRQSLARIAELDTRSTVVVASPINPRKQERARRKDLEALLPLLEAQGVAKLVMESRFPAADSKDASHFRTIVRRGLVDSIELGFADPAVEHRLWIPDQILGAYAESVTSPGLPKAWENEWEALRGTVTTIDVPL